MKQGAESAGERVVGRAAGERTDVPPPMRPEIPAMVPPMLVPAMVAPATTGADVGPTASAQADHEPVSSARVPPADSSASPPEGTALSEPTPVMAALAEEATTTPRRWALAVAGAVVGCIIAQYVLRHVHWIPGVILFGLSALVFGFASRIALRDADAASDLRLLDDARRGSSTWPRRSLALFAAAALCMPALWINVDPWNLSTSVWVIQGLGIALLLVAGFVADWGLVAPGTLPRGPLEVSPWTARIVLAVIVIGGTWVRFHNLDGMPFGFWFDEADVALIARRITEDASFRPVFIEVMPGYHAYILAIAFNFFGETVSAVRGVSAAFGIGTIFAGYLVGRELFGRSIGLALAFLVAFSRWSLTLSRIGMHNVTVPFFSLMMLGLMLRAYRRRSTLDWILAGLFAGGGMVFYSAMAASIIALASFAFVISLWSRERFAWAFPRFAAALMAALMVFIPLGKFVFTEGEVYFARNRITAIWSDSANVEDGERWNAVKDNIVSYGAMSHYKGDPNGRHNLPEEPMLPPIVAGLAILGGAAALFRLRRPLGAVSLFWVPMALIPGILSLPWESPNSLRGVAAQPVGLLLAGAAIAVTVAVAARTRRGVGWAMIGLLMVGLGFNAYREVSTYFGPQADDFAAWAAHSTKETMAANLVADAPDDTHVMGVMFLRGQKTIDFVTGDRPVDAWFDTDVSLPLAIPEGRDALLLTVPETYDITSQVSRLYPGAKIQQLPNETHWPEGERWPSELTSIRIPRADLQAAQGWTIEERDGVRRMTATLVVDQQGQYLFGHTEEIQSLHIDGVPLGPCPGQASSIGLAEGPHQVEMINSLADPQPALRWITPQEPEWSSIPVHHLLNADKIEGGFVGTWYANPDDRSAPSLHRIDGTLQMRFHELPLPHPYRTVWTSLLEVPADGEFTFFVRTDDAHTLTINDQVMLETDATGGEVSTAVQLPQGQHRISVDYLDTEGGSFLKLTWQQPDSERMPIPATLLTPVGESWNPDMSALKSAPPVCVPG